MIHTPELDAKALERLKNGKNLLAFSAGVDSSALFFLLTQAQVPFDMAIVDYQRRESSKKEVAYARQLSQTHGKRLFCLDTVLDESNFEANARKIRYDFFLSLCLEHAYDNLVTAHQLNDLTEWFMMQFSKGAGTVELLGMQSVQEEPSYTIVRPMLGISRDEILAFLEANALTYFEDASNKDPAHTRNRFRHAFTNELVQQYAKGIKKSFEYLRNDAALLFPETSATHLKKLVIFQSNGPTADVRAIDYYCKRSGYLLSAAQKEEIMRTKDCVVGGAIAIAIRKETIFIAPFIHTVIPKEVREAYRITDIPPKIRGYLYTAGIEEKEITRALNSISN